MKIHGFLRCVFFRFLGIGILKGFYKASMGCLFGFRVWVLGFGVQGLGFVWQGSGFRAV